MKKIIALVLAFSCSSAFAYPQASYLCVDAQDGKTPVVRVTTEKTAGGPYDQTLDLYRSFSIPGFGVLTAGHFRARELPASVNTDACDEGASVRVYEDRFGKRTLEFKCAIDSSPGFRAKLAELTCQAL